MFDHLQTEADRRRAKQRRHLRIVRAWEGASMAPNSTVPVVRAMDTEPTGGIGAATLLCIAGHPFSLGGMPAIVECRHAARAGFHSDALVVRLSGARTGMFATRVLRVADLETLFRIGRARLIHRDAPNNVAHETPRDIGMRGARKPVMLSRAEPGLLNPDASAETYRWVWPCDRADTRTPPKPRADAFTASRRSVAPGRPRTRRWTPSALAMAHAVIVHQLGSRRTTIRHIHGRIFQGWCPEWGRAPTYETVRVWVHAARDAVERGRLRVRPESVLRADRLGVGDSA